MFKIKPVPSSDDASDWRRGWQHPSPWKHAFYGVILDGQSEQRQEIVQWCMSQFGIGAPDVQLSSDHMWAVDIDLFATFFFKDDDDALEFRLRWG